MSHCKSRGRRSAALVALFTMGAAAHADVLFQENFNNSLGQFTSQGSVSTTAQSAKLKGSFYATTPAQITSSSINTTGFSNLRVSFTRVTTGLDAGEQGTASASINGGAFTNLEAVQTANGRVTLAIGASAQTVVLRYSLKANSTLESYELSNVTLEGDPAGGGGGGGGGGEDEFPPTTGTPSCTNILPGKFTCTLSGRTYNLVVPNAYGQGTRAVPLVVDIHGYTENADKEQARSHWDTLANTENFIVAYPNGKNNSWNAQGSCCGNPGTTTEQDVQFIRDVVAAVKQAGRIKADRVYVTGTSNGGSMSHTVACMAADIFNGAGPVVFPLSGGSYAQVVSACNPARPIPVLTFQGDNDTLVSYNGGSLGLSAQESRRAWAEIQNCSTTFTTTNPLSNVRCEIHSGCDGGVKTGLCTVVRGTHAGIYEEVGSPGVAGLIWNFFKSFWPQ